MTQNEIKPDMAQEKARLFAQYYGQNIMTNEFRLANDISPSVVSYSLNRGSSWFLLLTPLSQITDEDAIECYKIHFKDHLTKDIRPDASRIEFAKKYIISPIEVCISAVIDYLRSKGYALPFMGRSVPEMVDLGWIKLKGDSNRG